MNPGKFNRKITFQRFVEGVDDGFGGGSYWEDAKTVYAWPKTISGREYVEANADQNVRTTRWRIRYTTGLTEDMRIRYGERTFNIQAILQDDELRQTLTCVCEEVIPDAS
jgi:SPP1 family predicted phage head-tail adaptor